MGGRFLPPVVFRPYSLPHEARRLHSFFLWSPVLLYSVLIPYVEQWVWSGFVFEILRLSQTKFFLWSPFTSPKRRGVSPYSRPLFLFAFSPTQKFSVSLGNFLPLSPRLGGQCSFIDAPPLLSFSVPVVLFVLRFLKFPFGSLQFCVLQVDVVYVESFQEEIVGISSSRAISHTVNLCDLMHCFA